MSLFMIESDAYYFHSYFRQLYHFFCHFYTCVNSSTMCEYLVILVYRQLDYDSLLNYIIR